MALIEALQSTTILIDTKINFAMTHIQIPFLTFFAKIISEITQPIVLLSLALLASLYLFFHEEKREGLFFLAITIITSLITFGLQNQITRIQPTNAIIKITTSSFPNEQMIFLIVFLGLLVYFLAQEDSGAKEYVSLSIIIVAFTKIYLRSSWFSDLLVGAIIGSLILITSIWLYEKKLNKLH